MRENQLSNTNIIIWLIYFLAILVAVFVHEIGHCLVAWVHGIRAIPTPAKEYAIGPIPKGLEGLIALGGVISTAIVSFSGIILFVYKSSRLNSALFAAGLASPFLYSLLFFLKGRGHDATEFQDAQSAMGLSYEGHFLDWLFVSLCIIGFISWVWISRPILKVIPRLLLGAVLTTLFIATLQKINNVIFDPLFEPKINNEINYRNKV